MQQNNLKGDGASIGDRIIRASVAVGVAHLCFKFLGLIQAIVAGRAMNNMVFDTVYVFAFEGIILSIFFRLGEETIGPCFLPVFKEQLGDGEPEQEERAWSFANTVMSVQTVLLLGAIAFVMICPDLVIRLGTYWNREVDPERYDLARMALVWIAPALFCLSIGSTTYMILNGYKRFFLAAFGDASWKLAVLIALVIGMHSSISIDKALILGLLAGSVAKLATHLFGMLKELRRFRPRMSLNDPAFRTMLMLMAPMIAGTAFAIVRDYYNNVFVLSSIDTPGVMKANSFGRKLFLAIGWLVPYTVSIAMLPFFCELVDRDNKKRLGEILTQSGRMLLALFIPGAVLIAILSEPIAMVLFRGGEFGAETVRWAALSNACYILVLPAYALEYILVQGYFANRKMAAVVGIGMVFSAFSVAFSYIFIVRMGYRGVYALAAVALGYVIARTLKTITLVTVLRKSIPMFPPRETLLFLARTTIIAVAVGGAGWGCKLGFEAVISSGSGKVVLFSKCVVAGIAAAVVYFPLAWMLKVREVFEIFEWGLVKVKAKLGKS